DACAWAHRCTRSTIAISSTWPTPGWRTAARRYGSGTRPMPASPAARSTCSGPYMTARTGSGRCARSPTRSAAGSTATARARSRSKCPTATTSTTMSRSWRWTATCPGLPPGAPAPNCAGKRGPGVPASARSTTPARDAWPRTRHPRPATCWSTPTWPGTWIPRTAVRWKCFSTPATCLTARRVRTRRSCATSRRCRGAAWPPGSASSSENPPPAPRAGAVHASGRAVPVAAGVRALRAQAVHFQRLRLWHEAERAGTRIEGGDHVGVLEFHRAMAAVADQERHRVLRAVGVVAGDEGVDRLQLVDEAVGQQEVQRAVHRGRRVGAHALAGAHLVEQVVRLHRAPRLGDQAQHPRPDRGQAQPALLAGALDGAHEAARVVYMVAGGDARRSVRVRVLAHAPMMAPRPRFLNRRAPARSRRRCAAAPVRVRPGTRCGRCRG